MYSRRRGAAPARQRNSGIISLIQEDDWKIQVGWLSELASSGAALMMVEKISPFLAAVSPPSSWSVLREQVVSLDNHRPPSAPIACRAGRGPKEVDPDWGTDSDPPPATHTTRGDLWAWTSLNFTTAETVAEHQACHNPVRPPPSARQPSQRSTDHDEARPEDVVHYLGIRRQAGAPGEGGVLQLRVARNLYNYVSSSRELSPSQPPAPVPLACNRTVKTVSSCFHVSTLEQPDR